MIYDPSDFFLIVNLRKQFFNLLSGLFSASLLLHIASHFLT